MAAAAAAVLVYIYAVIGNNIIHKTRPMHDTITQGRAENDICLITP